MDINELNFFTYNCFYCRQVIHTPFKCPHCLVTSYCTEDHQKLDWDVHKFQCKSLQPNQNQCSETSNNRNNFSNSYANEEHVEPMINTGELDQIFEKVADNAPHCSMPLYELPPGVSKQTILKGHADYIIDKLNNFGHAVIDGLLGSNKANLVLEEVEKLLHSGIMKDGEVIESGKDAQVRGDKITWVSGDEPYCRNIKTIMNVIDHLITFCKKGIKNVIKGRTQAMIACYPGDGVGYKYHIDNTQEDGRCITCIYYINKDWNSSQYGGSLRIYPFGKSAYTDVEPLYDRLILFWSDKRSPHEVTPPTRKRFAITLWYFDANEREEVRKKYVSSLEKAFSAT